MSSNVKNILVFGGTGYVGRHIVEGLSTKRYNTYTFSRSENGENHISGSVLNYNEVKSAFEEADPDIVINAVGLSPVKSYSDKVYEKIHVDAVRNILELIEASDKNIRFIQISAQGADKNSKYGFFKSKGIAEEAIKESESNYIILRPAMIVGEDMEIREIFSKFSFLPILPFPKLEGLMRPIEVEDIAKVVKRQIRGNKTGVYDVVGKKFKKYNTLMKKTAEAEGLKFWIMPKFLSKAAFITLKIFPFTSLRGDLDKLMKEFADSRGEVDKEIVVK